MTATFTIREYGVIIAALTQMHASGTLGYADTLLLLNTAAKMAKAGIA